MILGNPVRKPIRPLGSPSIAGNPRVTNDFGPPSIAIEPTVIWPGGCGIAKGTYPDFHQGVDIGDGRCGADVIASAPGTVAFSALDSGGSQTIIIDHGSGIRTWYAHLATRLVAKGAKVARGQKIGTVGKTGATACHLHWAVEDRNFPGTVTAIRPSGRSSIKFVDGWPLLEQNVTVRPAHIDGIRIRTSTVVDPSTAHARTKGDRILRVSDGADLGAIADWRKYRGEFTGAEYTLPDGSKATRWWGIELDGLTLYLAAGYAERSA